jgi:hypothetical protein
MMSLALLDFDRVVRSRRRRLNHCHGVALDGDEQSISQRTTDGIAASPADVCNADPANHAVAW